MSDANDQLASVGQVVQQLITWGRSHVFRIASEEDLLRLKKIARANRSVPGDAEDIAFLEARAADRRKPTADR